jgi:RNA-directed DNA polymerase
VVLHPELEVIREAQNKISTWLSAMGLELHPDKTSIRHTFLAQPEQGPGFKFLGFWIRNYPVRTSEEAKRKSGYRTYIRPHPDNISRVLRQIKKVLFTIRDVKTYVRILNPIITGWSNVYRSVASKSTFTSMDKELVFKLIKWAKRKHPKCASHPMDNESILSKDGRTATIWTPRELGVHRTQDVCRNPYRAPQQGHG